MPWRFLLWILQFLQDKLEKVYRDPSVRERMSSIGLDPVWMGATRLAQAIDTDGEPWARVIKSANIKPD